MCGCNRRTVVAFVWSSLAALVSCSAARGEQGQRFLAEAFRMKDEAVARGDQPFGAVVVRAGAIVGYGPSRVVVDQNPLAHAERVALRDAQGRLGTKDMTGAVIYSTSRPCAACESALAEANVARMIFGAAAIDAGKPIRR